jgi:hypothetical protein
MSDYCPAMSQKAHDLKLETTLDMLSMGDHLNRGMHAPTTSNRSIATSLANKLVGGLVHKLLGLKICHRVFEHCTTLLVI